MRYSAARFCPPPPPPPSSRERSHFGQLKSDGERSMRDREINETDVHAFFSSRVGIVFFFFSFSFRRRRPRRKEEKNLARRRNSDERSAVHKFSSIAISLSGRGSRVIVPIKGLSGGAYFSFVYTGVYR